MDAFQTLDSQLLKLSRLELSGGSSDGADTVLALVPDCDALLNTMATALFQ